MGAFGFSQKHYRGLVLFGALGLLSVVVLWIYVGCYGGAIIVVRGERLTEGAAGFDQALKDVRRALVPPAVGFSLATVFGLYGCMLSRRDPLAGRRAIEGPLKHVAKALSFALLCFVSVQLLVYFSVPGSDSVKVGSRVIYSDNPAFSSAVSDVRHVLLVLIPVELIALAISVWFGFLRGRGAARCAGSGRDGARRQSTTRTTGA